MIAVSVAGVSTPVFFIGLLLMQYVGYHWQLLPFIGRGGPLWSLEGLRHIALPALTLGLIFIGPVARMTRTAALEVLSADHVRTARAKGLRERTVVIRHVLRNALIPVVTLIGLQAGYLLGGAVVTETIYSWPGVGRLAVGAILASDLPLAQGAILVLAVSFIVINMVVDMLYAAARPAGAAAAMTASRTCAPRRPRRCPEGPGAACCATASHSRRRCCSSPSRARAASRPCSRRTIPTRRRRRPFLPPFWSQGSVPDHLLGTDGQGRDMLSRLLYGTQATLVMGLPRGRARRRRRRPVRPPRRLLPPARRRPSCGSPTCCCRSRRSCSASPSPRCSAPACLAVVMALSIATIPDVARITRSAALVVMGQDYMEAGRAIGLPDRSADLALSRA